jgi:hypothetical protein
LAYRALSSPRGSSSSSSRHGILQLVGCVGYIVPRCSILQAYSAPILRINLGKLEPGITSRKSHLGPTIDSNSPSFEVVLLTY